MTVLPSRQRRRNVQNDLSYNITKKFIQTTCTLHLSYINSMVLMTLKDMFTSLIDIQQLLSRRQSHDATLYAILLTAHCTSISLVTTIAEMDTDAIILLAIFHTNVKRCSGIVKTSGEFVRSFQCNQNGLLFIHPKNTC